MEGRLSEFEDEWMHITQDPFVLGIIQGHLLHFNHKFPIVKPTHKCEVNVLKTQESLLALEVRSRLSEGTTDIVPVNKEFFT